MKHIKELAKSLSDTLKLGMRQEENYIFDNWKAIAGAEIASMAEPFKMDGKKLYLHVENSIVMNEITYKKRQIKEKVNKAVKKAAVSEIVVRIKQN